jgi:hypothetical protein
MHNYHIAPKLSLCETCSNFAIRGNWQRKCVGAAVNWYVGLRLRSTRTPTDWLKIHFITNLVWWLEIFKKFSGFGSKDFGVWVLGFKIFAKFSTTENFDINPVKEWKSSSGRPTGRRLLRLQRGRTPTDWKDANHLINWWRPGPHHDAISIN